MNIQRLAHLKTYAWVRRFCEKRFGEIIFATKHNAVGACLINQSIQEHRRTLVPLDINLSSRIFEEKPVIYEPFLTQLFYISFCSHIDAQRRLGKGINESIQDFMELYAIHEDDFGTEGIRTAKKIYDRYRIDKN